MTTTKIDPLPATLFDRLDNAPDLMFYQVSRFVTHIDESTIDALTSFYREILFDGADVLDLMSSWISHLPEGPALGRVAGLGMNEPELAANPRLDDRIAQVEQQAAAQGGNLPPRNQLAQQVLERMVMDEIQLQMARRANLSVDDTELNRQLRSIAESNNINI